jgi:hypothetical protein
MQKVNINATVMPLEIQDIKNFFACSALLIIREEQKIFYNAVNIAFIQKTPEEIINKGVFC